MPTDLAIDDRMVNWQPYDPAEETRRKKAASSVIDERMVKWQPIGADPSLIDVALNAGNKALAGVPDSLLNTPNRLLNLGKAGFGAAATAFGRPDLAPALTPDLEYAAALLRKMGAIGSNAEPTTTGGRLLDATVQGAVGGILNPAGSWGRLAANAAMGASAGAVGDAAAQGTGNDLLGMSAGMAAPAGFANVPRLARRVLPEPQINRVLKSGLASENIDQIIPRLQQAQELVPGSLPMSQQVANSPALSQFARSTRNIVPGGGQLTQRDQAQNAARLGALDGIAPGAFGLTAGEAATNAGAVFRAEVGPARQTMKDAVTEAYKVPALQNAHIALPDGKQAAAAVREFYPGEAFNEAPADLKRLVGYLEAGQPIPLKEFDALRKIAGNRATDLADSDRTASAAFSSVKNLFNEAEAAAVARSGNKFEVTGQGPWGPQYGNLAGDPNNAVAHLLRMRAGEVPSALSHRDVPQPLDLVWGKAGTGAHDGYGVSKLERFHPEALPDLQGLLNDLSINPGKSGPNRIVLDNQAQDRGVVSLNYQGDPKTWLLSAFRKGESPLEGALHGASKTIDTAGIAGEGNHLSTTGQSLPDIATSFKAFDQSVTAPQAGARDPRQYTGGLLAPDQAQALDLARTLHQQRMQRFDTGPARAAWQTGTDGTPKRDGAQLFSDFFNPGARQRDNIDALWQAAPGNEAVYDAYRKAAISDLIGRAVNKDSGLLNNHPLKSWMEARSEALPGLLNTDQMGQLRAVQQDTQRAAKADSVSMGRAVGSNTAQNLEGGLLFGKPVNLLRGVPYLGAAIGAGGLDYLRNTVKANRARQMQDLLLDPQAMARALGPRQYDPFYLPELPAGGLLGLSNALSGNP